MRSATRNRVGKDPEYLEFIHEQPCVCCYMLALVTVDGYIAQIRLRMVEAAHVGKRGLSQKCPDRETIPLCAEHHRFGTYSHHRLGNKFWKHWGLDRERVIAELQARYEKERAA